jgi:transglutaminase superfamily protein
LSEVSAKRQSRLVANWRAYLLAAIFLVTLAFGVSEAISQHRESRYVAEMAQNIVRQANARDTNASIIALRDYLRRNVTANNYSVVGRPFFRDTAADALQTGKGRCGESTRAFINMAESLGIHAQRLYLEGELEHVVALVTLSDGRQLLVDSIDPPYFLDIEELHPGARFPDFNYYSSINLHRWLKKPSLPANTYDPPGLSYFMENPHALKALFYFTLGAACMALWTLSAVRRYLRARRPARVSAAAVPGQSPALAAIDR